MAGSPQFKVYDSAGTYQAATKTPEQAAAVIAGVGFEGWTIRDGHSPRAVLWTEGAEEFPASESFDRLAELVLDRRSDRRDAARR
jgi:hypothetical protein